MNDKTLVLVDGENLVLRFEALCKKGMKPISNIKHREGTYVWHSGIASKWFSNILRVSYYTTLVGDDPALDALCNELSKIWYHCHLPGIQSAKASISPRVFKKNKKSTKTKSVDINLTIDALRHAYNRDVGRIVICSGDGDYLPLVKEIMRNGVIVNIAAFSNGCHPAMKYVSDDFIELDRMFFE